MQSLVSTLDNKAIRPGDNARFLLHYVEVADQDPASGSIEGDILIVQM